MACYHLSYQQLLQDLHQAYLDARRHKRNKPYQLHFEENLEHNLSQLCYELWSRTYHPLPSTCFLISDPKLREVFAAQFRDRIVHHLYYNYVHEMLERTFIQDSYSCIKGRGTHYGINRLERHIRQESQNYQEPCYVLKLDIRGYFMHINRQKLLGITTESLHRIARHRIHKGCAETWQERVDMEFVDYLTQEIVLLDPSVDCCRKGNREDWKLLPHDKSLFHSPAGCGLPIGNLTSQLFSNVYLNVFDKWMKRTLHCRHYGRYVDDSFVVSADRDWLHDIISKVRMFLQHELGLTLHEGKVCIASARMGVEFLGAYLKPFRRYVSNHSLRRMSRKLDGLQQKVDTGLLSFTQLRSSLNSFLGVLSHYSSYRLRSHLMTVLHDFSALCCFDNSCQHVFPPETAKSFHLSPSGLKPL